AAFGTKDAAADRTTKAKGIAQRQDRLAEQEIVIGRELHRGELFVLGSADFEQSHVGETGPANSIALELPAIGQFYPNPPRAIHHMEIGQHKTFFIDNHARTEAVLRVRLAMAVVRVKELAEKVFQ